MSAHTPGPWTVGRCSWNDEDNVCYELIGIKKASHSDANLIAAAPELLDLLKYLIDLEGPQPGNSAWAVRVNAAIAKATGAKA